MMFSAIASSMFILGMILGARLMDADAWKTYCLTMGVAVLLLAFNLGGLLL